MLKLLLLIISAMFLQTLVHAKILQACPKDQKFECTNKCIVDGRVVECPTCYLTDEEEGHQCKCPPNYKGDARLHGSGCTKVTKLNEGKTQILFWVLMIVVGVCLVGIAMWVFKKYWGSTEAKTGNGVFSTCKLYTYSQIQDATDFFREDRILGQGGQGVVYRGELDGLKVAIKACAECYGPMSKVDLMNEILILSTLEHRNLVKLIGYTIYASRPYLVYLLAENGALDGFLHERMGNAEIKSWKKLFEIAVGICEGLNHLHNGLCGHKVIHRDLKASNIMLGEDYVAKIGDFGLSKHMDEAQNEVKTFVKGTEGYVAPELVLGGYRSLTTAADVFSLGVILAEIVLGKRAVRPTGISFYFLSDYIQTLAQERLELAFDKTLADQNKGQMAELLKIAQDCCKPEPNDRPCIAEILARLERIKA